MFSFKAITVAMPSMAPAAPSKCPVMDLVPDKLRFSRFPKTFSMPTSSEGSPTGVEVACRLM